MAVEACPLFKGIPYPLEELNSFGYHLAIKCSVVVAAYGRAVLDIIKA